MDPVAIRPATADDARAIAEVHVRGWQAGYRGILPEEFLAALSVDRRTEFWARVFTQGPEWRQRTWVAEHLDGVAGFICVGACRDEDLDPAHTGELQAIYIDPPAWRAGIGTKLHATGMAFLHEGGYREAALWVLRDNARARAFYERLRWWPDGSAKVEEWDGVRMDEVRYRIGLAAAS